jgi:DNA polymerase-1
MIGFDTETGLIAQGLLCPPMICLTLSGSGEPPSWARPNGAVVRETPHGEWMSLLSAEMAVRATIPLLETECIGHNTAYDLAELSENHRIRTGSDDAIRAVFDALENGRVFDTKIREQLLRIATGDFEFRITPTGIKKTTFDLATLVDLYLGIDISETKTDPNAWRLRYRELSHLPVSDWPVAAQDYAMLDAFYPTLVALAQVASNPKQVGPYDIHDGSFAVHTEGREVAAAFALHLMAVWGFRTDPDQVAQTIAEWERLSSVGVALGERLGFIRVSGRDKGKPGTINKKELCALVERAYGGNPPRTDPSKTYPDGQISTSTETLAYSRDPDLIEYSKSLEYTLYLTRYADILRSGVSLPITSSPKSLQKTGRTGWEKPAMQQPPREGGYRDCFVPRPGYLYGSADYDFIELCALAQVCLWALGRSTLADTINAGIDPHIRTAIEIMRAEGHPQTPRDVTHAEEMKRAPDTKALIKSYRQLAKAANFGLPGLLGPDTFVEYAHANYDVTIPVDKAAEVKRTWLRTYPEMPSYFDWVLSQLDEADCVQQFVSGRVRGDLRPTTACNTFFQGLVADGAKLAAFLVAKASYAVRGSPLFGSRPVLLLHDELICEVPGDRSHEAATEMASIMVDAMRTHIPDVRVNAKPVLMRRWLKGIDPTYDASGRLVPTERE